MNGKAQSSSPADIQQKVLMQNNNNVDITISNGTKVEASSPGSDKSRLFTPKVLPPDDDRILKEMVCVTILKLSQKLGCSFGSYFEFGLLLSKKSKLKPITAVLLFNSINVF